MSQSRGYFDDNPELESALEWAERWYHIPLLLVLLGFMLWNRVRSWQNFIIDGEVYFSGNDAWYHLRTTQYTVQNWPATMPFDPWTYFPYGTSSGQFGTFFDQIVATVALIVGLGSPSDQTVAMTLLFAPAVFGTAVAIPTYVIGRRLGGRLGGVTAVAVLAFSAGSFLQRSMVGFSDHQVAEALFQTLGVLGVMVAVSVAARDKPIYEQFLERDLDALRDTVGWSVLAGVAIAMYLWTWPPGVLLLGILGLFFLLRLCVEYVHDHSPEHTAIAGAITMATVAVLSASRLQTLQITATSHSLLQPGMALAVAVGCVFMAWLARYMEQSDYERYFYPATVFGILAVGIVFMAVALPDLYGFFVNNLSRVVGFVTTASGGTVGEVAPLSDPSVLFDRHGFAVLVAAGGAVWLAGRQILDENAPAQDLLVVVWGAILLMATFTQRRFAYYLVVPIAVLTGMAVGRVVRRFDLVPDDGIEYYQVLTILTIILVVIAPLVLIGPTTTEVGQSANPGAGIQGWDESLQWMQTHTPAEGTYGTGEGDSLEYYGTYPRQEDYDYEQGAYGVMSWWDYGHWITTRAERIPNANPFQQGSDTAAQFLIAPNETAANGVLDDVDEDDAKTRYVAVDWKMAETNGNIGGKFFAPPAFVDGVQASDYYSRLYVQTQSGGFRQVTVQKQAYYETTVARLYRFHGSAAEPQPLVVDWENKQTSTGQQYRGAPTNEEEPEGQPQGRILRQFESMEAARQYVQNDPTSQLGGYAGTPAERVPAMEHYRLVGSSESEAFNSARYQSSAWTKIFERVPGATVEGSAPANTTVRAAVQMYNPATNKTFVYRQRVQSDQNGNFEMTVPYSTTGYDEWGTDEGYTNVSVRSRTAYQFTAVGTNNGTRTAFTDTTQISEGQVIGEEETAATVELTPVEVTTGNATDGSLAAPSTPEASTQPAT
ncbi:oligosaccharyl transferase, archaeosortase A system-associated [Haloarcula salina]|uniref:dolichyl-phosphooligosaccharide-protein glycotransferase n=1 Tax=Haloarcula salina TaxID=1429914 RepID=A0AA41FYX6_9EURY|nr:oligosaccharyl transferase, archaeosortase A system-associated [Haloarcula salina]MBV0901125.1 oligosaccharyl transferase, archaeosortase A system-associated [Haloarcula salina]